MVDLYCGALYHRFKTSRTKNTRLGTAKCSASMVSAAAETHDLLTVDPATRLQAEIINSDNMQVYKQ